MSTVLLLIIASCLCGKDDPPIVAEPHRGFYSAPISVVLSVDEDVFGPSSTPIVIRYTISTFSLNASLTAIANAKHPSLIASYPNDPPTTTGNGIANCPTYPSQTVGKTYTDAIPISVTTILKVRAYGTDPKTKQVVESKEVTHTYIFPADVLKQGTMGGDIVSRYGSDRCQKSFLDIPSFHISSAGPYPLEDSRQVDDPVRDPPRPPGQVEWLDAKRPKDNWQKECEYFRRGGYTRRLKKKSIKIDFTDGDLEFDLFNTKFDGYDNGMAVQSTIKYNKLILRVSSDNSFYSYLQPVTYFRGVWNDLVMQDLGLKLVHSRLVHVYFNAQYQGIVTLREIIDDNWMQLYCGGNKSQYEAIDQIYVGDPVLDPTPFFDGMVANKNWAYFKNRIDWESFYAFHVHMHWEDSLDISDQHNYQGGGSNFIRAAGLDDRCNWRFFYHDNDGAFYDYGTGDAVTVNYLNPTMSPNWNAGLKGFFKALTDEAHPDFIQGLQDFAYKAFTKKGGVLTADQNQNRWNRILSAFSLNSTYLPEASRWGWITTKEWTWGKPGGRFPFPDGMYLQEYLDNLRPTYENFLVRRADFVVAQYKIKGWYSSILAPAFSIDSGSVVKEGTTVVMTCTDPQYRVAYTTNDQDPRLEGGVRNPAASLSTSSTASFTLTKTTRIKARQWTGSAWGVLEDMLYIVNHSAGCLLCGNLIVTEVNYNHKTTKYGANNEFRTGDAEFIEVRNIGSTPLTLTNAKITAKFLKYTFPTATLNPGQFWVIAKYADDFPLVYGKRADGAFTGKLPQDSGDHSIKIIDALGNLVQEFTYDTELPWAKFADGYGYTIAANVDNYVNISQKKSTTAKHYHLSSKTLGSPWGDDPYTYKDLGLRVEFVNWKDQWFSMRNPTKKAIDLSGWAVKESYNSDPKDAYIFPNGTTIQPDELMTVKAKKTDLKLNPRKAFVIFRAVLADGEYLFNGDWQEWDPEANAMAF